MKWQTLSLTFFASAGLASPAAVRDTQEVYNLKLSSGFSELNGQYLSVNGNNVGYFQGRPTVQFTPVPSTEHKGNVELHRYPATSGEVIAFIGKKQNLLLSVTKPADSVANGTTCDWQSFSLVAKSATKGKPANLVTYSGVGGRWVAYPQKDGWTVNWQSADAITIEVYQLVDVVYEPAGSQT